MAGNLLWTLYSTKIVLEINSHNEFIHRWLVVNKHDKIVELI